MSDLISISRLLMKFTPQQLQELIPTVLDINWDKLLTTIVHNKLCCQKKFIVMVALDMYETAKPTKADIETVRRKLHLYNVVTNNNFNWFCEHLSDQMHPLPQVDSIERNVLSAYRSDARNADVLIYEDEPLLFIMTVEKRITKQGIKFLPPIHFVLHMELPEQYFFYFPRTTSNHHNDYICKAMGFQSHSKVALTGKDVRSLYSMIVRSLDPNFDRTVPQFEPISYVEEEGVVDFTLGNERSKYANELLPGLTKLNSFTVHANNEWRGRDEIPEFSDGNVVTSLTFSTRSEHLTVEDMFKEMIKIGMVRFPIPSYISNLGKIPKNIIHLQGDDSDMEE